MPDIRPDQEVPVSIGRDRFRCAQTAANYLGSPVERDRAKPAWSPTGEFDDKRIRHRLGGRPQVQTQLGNFIGNRSLSLEDRGDQRPPGAGGRTAAYAHANEVDFGLQGFEGLDTETQHLEGNPAPWVERQLA